MSFERPTPEKKTPHIEESEVVSMLRKTGDILNCELYHKWRDQEEDKLDGSALDNIDFILRDARLRRTAGFEEEAGLAYAEALESAELHNSPDLEARIRREWKGETE